MPRFGGAAAFIAVLAACAVRHAEAFHSPCGGAPLRVAPAARRGLAVSMTQPPPPAKLELPAAKLQAEAVNAVQWGTIGDAIPPPRGGEAARSSALAFAASYAGIGQRIAIAGFLVNALYLLYLLQAGK